MARRRRTGTMRHPSDCLAAERRASAVNIFCVVSGIKLAISGVGGGGVSHRVKCECESRY